MLVALLEICVQTVSDLLVLLKFAKDFGFELRWLSWWVGTIGCSSQLLGRWPCQRPITLPFVTATTSSVRKILRSEE